MFSTGDKIDSLTISGTVIDAKSSKPLSSVWIGLYKSNNDSVLYKEDPIYIVKSCKNGKFSFSNLSNESFYIYAIDDLDNNLIILYITNTTLHLLTTRCRLNE